MLRLKARSDGEDWQRVFLTAAAAAAIDKAQSPIPE